MRKIININNDWLFSKTQKNAPTDLQSEWEKINLPHTYNGSDGQDGGNDYYRGKCFYAKEISKNDFEEDRLVFLEINGANSSSEVFIDGEKLFTHHGGYSTFRVDITDKLKDKSILSVATDNSPNDFVYPQMADFTFYGGLYRDVNIITVAKSHFDLEYYGGPGIQITPEIKGTSAEIDVKAYVKNAENCDIKFAIKDNGKIVAEKIVSASKAQEMLTIENVHLWNGRKDPYLYTMEAELISGEKVLDNISARFGCRTFEIDPDRGFILNGKEYPLRGVSRHQDRPGIGNALTEKEHREDIDLIYELGANTIRLAHYQHSQTFYDLCDEKGFVLWAEIPYISKHMPSGRENTISQMKELVIQNYNHPSIFVWGLSNEITMNGAKDESLVENHKELNDLVHSLDKTRLTTVAAVTMCGIDEEYVHISDVVSYNHYFGWYGGNVHMNGKWFDDFHKKYPKKAIGLSEYGAEALNWHTSNPEQGDYTEEYQSYYHEEMIKQIIPRKYIWATHVWNMFDFAADARSEGGENGMNHKGLVTFDRQYKKDSFYAYKAWLSDEKFVHICSKRYVDRVEDVTKVTVYSNCDEVELFANGKSVGKQKKGEYPFFRFEVKNEGETILKAVAGEYTDESKIRKVETFNEDYRMKDEGSVINWFEIDTPAGYLSINDTLGDILKPFKGKIVLVKTLLKLKNTLSGDSDKPKEKEKKKKSGGKFSVMGFDINKTMIEMAKGFTVKRILMMIGGQLSKEDVLEINKSLNKIKKKE